MNFRHYSNYFSLVLSFKMIQSEVKFLRGALENSFKNLEKLIVALP
jgi:hypothetical protein